MSKTRPLRVGVHPDVCVGSGMCTRYAPATFDQDDSSHVVVTRPPGDADDAVIAAVSACPTGALYLIEDD